MALMEEVLEKYKQGKFRKCLELIKLINKRDDLVENFALENCKLICESLVIIEEDDPDKIYEMQEQHFSFFEKVTSVEAIGTHIPLHLKLNATFNFIFWLLLYNDKEMTLSEAEEYLEVVNKGLLSVLGRQVTFVNECTASDKILTNLRCLKDFIPNEDYITVFLILELVIIIILYVIKLNRTLVKDCLRIVTLFIEESKYSVNFKTTTNEFVIKPLELCLFKFGLLKTATLLSEPNLEVIDYLYLLEAVFLFLLEDFKGSLKSMQKNVQTNVKSLWNYLVIISSFELEDWNLCGKFLKKLSSLVIQKNFKTRYHIMQGKLKCVERNHKEALKQFENALQLSPNCPIVYYYIGQEYGKMGLTDSMVENFEKLIKALQNEDLEDDFKPNFETIVLDWIHPTDEIIEAEAYYALAISYGLNENFKNSAEAFEKVLQYSEEQLISRKRRVIDVPSFLTILHEAAIMNLLLGNLVKAEQLALDAVDRYVPQNSPKKPDHQITFLYKDIEWLQRVIHQELLENDLEPKDLPNEIFYSEDLIFFFPQNIIALLILSEIQRIQEVEDYRATISSVFGMFSKYLASMQKKNHMDENEKHVLTLVKALAGKTCVRIAAIQAELNEDSNIEKMFKRALSCNKGDKDALCNYCKFLLKAGKNCEALKLWNTFFNESTNIEIDSLQSFSLRYFLTNKITKRELESIQREITNQT